METPCSFQPASSKLPQTVALSSCPACARPELLSVWHADHTNPVVGPVPYVAAAGTYPSLLINWATKMPKQWSPFYLNNCLYWLMVGLAPIWLQLAMGLPAPTWPAPRGPPGQPPPCQLQPGWASSVPLRHLQPNFSLSTQVFSGYWIFRWWYLKFSWWYRIPMPLSPMYHVLAFVAKWSLLYRELWEVTYLLKAFWSLKIEFEIQDTTNVERTVTTLI